MSIELALSERLILS